MNATSEPDAQPSARRQVLTLVALFCILPASAVGGGLAIAPLLALAGMLAAPWTPPRTIHMLTALLLGLSAWAALSIFWSPMPRPEQAVKILAVTMTGLLLVYGALRVGDEQRALVRASLLASMLTLGTLLVVEALWDMPFNRAAQPDATTEELQRNPGRGVLVLEIFGFAALGAALALRRKLLRRALATLLLVAMIAVSPGFEMAANCVVLIVGAAAFAFGAATPRRAPAIVGAGLALWMLVAPWAMLAARGSTAPLEVQLPPSWGMRLQIWSYAAERIAEKPWLGWGLDASRAFNDERMLGDIAHAAIPLHPHSLSLQIWLETGAVGACLAAALVVALGFTAARLLERIPAAVATSGMATLGLAWNLSYGAWQEWMLALPFIMAAAAIVLRRDAQPSEAT